MGGTLGWHTARHVLVSGAAAIAVTACAAGDTSTIETLAPVPETVALGGLPDQLSDLDVPVATVPNAPEIVAPTSTTEPPIDPITGPIGDAVFGNRIILIGDTVFASTAPRSDGSMCDALEAFGWQGEMAAESGRFVDFGRVVYDARIAPNVGETWDAVGIMLGNHFSGDLADFQQAYDELLEAVEPRPTVVYTLVENDTYQADLNAFIRDVPESHANVVVLDWAEIVAAEPEVLLADTPSGLSDEGRDRLALFTAATLGVAPLGVEPGCVEPFFVDDSAIVL